MHDLDFIVGRRPRHKFDENGNENEPRTQKCYTWVAVAIGGSAVIGAGVGLYGANKQAQSQADAQKQNADLQTQQNNSAWQSYLMSRGVNPMGATAGNIPVGAPAINARLPLWANVNVATGPKTWRRTGGAAVAPATPGRIISLNTGGTPAMAAPSAPSGSNSWWRDNAAGAYALN